MQSLHVAVEGRSTGQLDLEPRRRVYIKAFYFDTGHRALDALCDRLVRDLAQLA